MYFAREKTWGIRSSWMWSCATGYLVPDVLRQRSGIIFKSQNVPENEEPSLYFHRSTHSPAFLFAISALDDETNMLFRYCGDKIPSDPASHLRRVDTSISISRNPKFGKLVCRLAKPSNLSHTRGKNVKGFMQFHRSGTASILRQTTYVACPRSSCSIFIRTSFYKF